MADLYDRMQPLVDSASDAVREAFITAGPVLADAYAQAADAAGGAYAAVEPQLSSAYTALEPHLNTALGVAADAYAQAAPHLEAAASSAEGALAPYVDVPRWGAILQKGYALTVAGNASTSAFADEGMSDSPFPLTHGALPALACSIYLLLVINMMPKDNKGPRTGGLFLRIFSVLHNFGMMIFSYFTFVNVGALVKYAFVDLKLDAGQVLIYLTDNHWDVLGFWSWLFYLSKYYEFIDTFTVIAKNRRPIALQYIHHAGAVLSMWALLMVRLPGMLPFVLFNSGVHTIMYGYYMVTSFGIRLPVLRPLITTMQVTQFVVGLLWSNMPPFIEGGIKNEGQTAVGTLSSFYVIVLLGMFLRFAYHNYCPCLASRSPSRSSSSSPKSSSSSSSGRSLAEQDAAAAPKTPKKRTEAADTSSSRKAKKRSAKKRTAEAAAPATPLDKSSKSPARRRK